MEIDADVLIVELRNEFDNWNIRKGEDEEVYIRESVVPAGMYRQEYHKKFVERLEEFVMMHTEDWVIASDTYNRIEGYSFAVLTQD